MYTTDEKPPVKIEAENHKAAVYPASTDFIVNLHHHDGGSFHFEVAHVDLDRSFYVTVAMWKYNA